MINSTVTTTMTLEEASLPDMSPILYFPYKAHHSLLTLGNTRQLFSVILQGHFKQ